MMSMRRFGILAVVVALSLGGVGRADAGFLTDTLQGTYYFPTVGSTYQGPLSEVVNPTATLNFTSVSSVVTISNTSITETFTTSTGYSTSTFNGFVITDLTKNPAITGFTATSNIAGFVPADVSFTSNSVSLNQQSLSVTSASFVTINLQFAAVPEPSSLAMCGIASLAGLGYIARRRMA